MHGGSIPKTSIDACTTTSNKKRAAATDNLVSYNKRQKGTKGGPIAAMGEEKVKGDMGCPFSIVAWAADDFYRRFLASAS